MAKKGMRDISGLEDVRSNQAASKTRSPQASCELHARQGARLGRVASRMRIDRNVIGRDPMPEMPIIDGGAEADRLWRKRHVRRRVK